MGEDDFQKGVRLLEEIRDHQRLQLERQAEALAIQKEQFALVKAQTERTERIQDRAERLQDSSAQLVRGARKAIAVVLPIVIGLIIYLSWLIFR